MERGKTDDGIQVGELVVRCSEEKNRRLTVELMGRSRDVVSIPRPNRRQKRKERQSNGKGYDIRQHEHLRILCLTCEGGKQGRNYQQWTEEGIGLVHEPA